jgi:hypothetical protein
LFNLFSQQENHSSCLCVQLDIGKAELCLKNTYSGIIKLK